MAGLRQLWERARASRWPDRVRRVGLVTAILAGALYFGSVIHGHYAIGDWLAWRYLLCWAYALFFLAACTSTGHLIVQRVAPRLPLRICSISRCMRATEFSTVLSMSATFSPLRYG